jgi:DNA segregation ATPase FtsK/SpoIIIE, S-DNA-T family
MQAQRLVRLAGLVTERVAQRPPVEVPPMPARVPYPALPTPRRDELVIGVEADFVAAVSVALCEGPLLVAGRPRSGRTSMLAGLAGLARRSDRPPSEVTLVGGVYDRVLTDPAAVVDWLPELRTALAAERATDPTAWRLVLVDDAHLWERGWESGGATRDAVAGLAALIDAAPGLGGLGVVLATDTDDARSRQHVPGATAAARRGRRGVLLQPDFADGAVLSVSVPTHTVEPTTGPGRGIYCGNGSVQVVHVVSVVDAEGERS